MSTKANDFSFEASLKELDAIAAWFEQPDVDLDDSLAKFERGLELSTALKQHISSVENQIVKIQQRFDQTPAHTDDSPSLLD